MENKRNKTPLFQAPETDRWLNFFSSYWFVVFLAVAFFITIVSFIIRALLPPTIPVQENSWGNLTPGHSKYNDLVAKLGPPLETKPTKDGYELTFKSELAYKPYQAVTNKEGTVEFMKEFLKYDATNLLKNYSDKYGKPDFTLIDQETHNAYSAHVFLKQGLVIVAHNLDGTVAQKWYFTPTEKETFLTSWGKNLGENPVFRE